MTLKKFLRLEEIETPSNQRSWEIFGRLKQDVLILPQIVVLVQYPRGSHEFFFKHDGFLVLKRIE
jgi:hypothetical protein